MSEPAAPFSLESRIDEGAEPSDAPVGSNAGFEPSDDLGPFLPGDVDLKLEIGFDGYSNWPSSLVLALVGWTELDGSFDVGVVPIGPVTVGLGAEAYYGRPWLAELVVEGLVNALSDASVDVDVWNAGVLGRATVHIGDPSLKLPSSIDPYAVAIVGPTFGKAAVRFDDGSGNEVASVQSTDLGLRVGAGFGANVVMKSRLLGGVELRYLLGLPFRQETTWAADADGVEYSYTRAEYQKPPRGFGWMVSVGYRL